MSVDVSFSCASLDGRHGDSCKSWTGGVRGSLFPVVRRLQHLTVTLVGIQRCQALVDQRCMKIDGHEVDVNIQ